MYTYGYGSIANIMNGGPGNDIINNDGDAIYLFAVGDGHDTITDSSGTDVIKVSGVANQSGIHLSRDFNNGLVITIISSGDSITVTNHLYSNSYKIEKLQLMDGDAVIAELDLVTFFPAIYGTAGNDVIYDASGGCHN